MLNGAKVKRVEFLPELKMYELTLEGRKEPKRVAAITTKGEPHMVGGVHDGTYDHLVRFSDGTEQRHVVSAEVLTIPDYPALQPE